MMRVIDNDDVRGGDVDSDCTVMLLMKIMIVAVLVTIVQMMLIVQIMLAGIYCKFTTGSCQTKFAITYDPSYVGNEFNDTYWDI